MIIIHKQTYALIIVSIFWSLDHAPQYQRNCYASV
jgi:hypothetical protein